MRRPGPNERLISEYGVQLEESALTIDEKMDMIVDAGPRGRADVSEFIATDAIVAEDLVDQYARAREWETRPIEAVDVMGGLYVLDGHHRLAAAAKADTETITYREVGAGVSL